MIISWIIERRQKEKERKIEEIKEKEAREYERRERLREEIKEKEARERKQRKKEEEERRKNTPFVFSQEIPIQLFNYAVEKAIKKIKRINSFYINGPIVEAWVTTQSGINEWWFKIDFNNYGHYTGKYWIKSENKDSEIPDRVAQLIVEEISRRLNQ